MTNAMTSTDKAEAETETFSTWADDGSTPVRVAALTVYPIKSCAGVSLTSAQIARTGLAQDRQWMLVDADGEFLSQREHPRMALIQPRWDEAGALWVQAPGQAPLCLATAALSAPRAVRVWDDVITGCGGDAQADAWFSQYLGLAVQLVVFASGQQRLSSRRWTGELEAENAFSDGYPILVISTASLDELNRRLQAQGHPAVTMARFRPNLVLEGLGAHGEDALDEVQFGTPQGVVRLRLVKPCPRCPMPNIDPLTAEQGHEPGDTLAAYRQDPRVDGAITFGMNAVIVEGVGAWLHLNQDGAGTVQF